MIVTVKGPIEPDELGVTMSHEHIMCDISQHSGKEDNLLDDIDLASKEVAFFHEAGGKSLVDVTTDDIGRDAGALAMISDKTGVNIVTCTGYYAEELYPDYVHNMDIGELAAHMIDEAVNGIGETGVRPGIIGELRSNDTDVTVAEEKVLRASARTHKATGLAISLHSGYGRPGPNQLAILQQEGVDVERVIVCHGDVVWDEDVNKDMDYYQGILDSGAFLSFDAIGWKDAMPEEEKIVRICALLEKGYVRQLLFSLDLCRKSFYHACGGHGYDHVLEHFVPRLREHDVSQIPIETILIENPRRVLSTK